MPLESTLQSREVKGSEGFSRGFRQNEPKSASMRCLSSMMPSTIQYGKQIRGFRHAEANCRERVSKRWRSEAGGLMTYGPRAILKMMRRRHLAGG